MSAVAVLERRESGGDEWRIILNNGEEAENKGAAFTPSAQHTQALVFKCVLMADMKRRNESH